ncbi:4-hydroxythreonine-4-phosphate dehydrogenase PdxA [Clostridium sp. AN503]|uniref:4-hydroxythreonine-4-phosphate dehydrogenase PdxA n=1 Tax=Clostridium sp. AN503 TaxID=3160598 RepID=UPI00345AC424
MGYLGITMGDPAGVGAEIVLKAMHTDAECRKNGIIFGSRAVTEYYNHLLGYGYQIKEIKAIEDFDPNCINVVDPEPVSMEKFNIGQVSSVCGHAAFVYVKTAIDWAISKKIDAVVTAPLNKEALHLAGHLYDGHTEIFNDFAGTGRYAMLLWSDKMKVIHVTTHVAMREACNRIKKPRVEEVIRLADETLKQAGYSSPRIAVAGLNPHSGENGIFGREEIDEIEPAVRCCAADGIQVEGPIPPDTVFLKMYQGKYDIVVAMYHDQGHIPLKLLAFDDGVNMTVGLSIIRTSVDHGTAFDIAGKGIANPTSMLAAIHAARRFQK